MGTNVFDLVNLDSQKSFEQLGTTFGGILQNGSLLFDDERVCGQISYLNPEEEISLRIWKLKFLSKIIINKPAVLSDIEHKFNLVYFLNPSIFQFRTYGKKWQMPGHRNTIFFTGKTPIEFTVLPKQPFYAFDISFTASWLTNKFANADPAFEQHFDTLLHSVQEDGATNSCSVEEYKILRQLEMFKDRLTCHPIYIRSRVYKLITQFFLKAFVPSRSERRTILYEQVMEAERLLVCDTQHLPCIKNIAQRVNLSISTLRRQFRLVFGQGIEDYHIMQKLEVARNLLLQKPIAIKTVATLCGYKQPSAFIKMFTRQYGCSPGMMRAAQSGLHT